MPPVTALAGDTVLSVDQAAGLLAPEEQPDEAVEAAEDAPVVEEPTPAEEVPAEAAAEPAEETEGEEVGAEEETAAPVIDPPPFWSGEDKAWFSAQPADAQARILAYEKNRDAITANSLKANAEAVKAAQGEAVKLAKLATDTQAVIDTAKATFERPVEGLFDAQGTPLRWSDINWDATMKADPAYGTQLWTRFQFETGRLQQLEAARQSTVEAAQTEAFKAYVSDERGKLHTLNPELAKDPAKLTEVATYLAKQGYAPEAIHRASALDLVTAQKAMLYDLAQAKGKQVQAAVASTTKPPARAQSTAVKPTAATEQVAPQKRAVAEAENRFAQTRSVNDAVAALNARTG